MNKLVAWVNFDDFMSNKQAIKGQLSILDACKTSNRNRLRAKNYCTYFFKTLYSFSRLLIFPSDRPMISLMLQSKREMIDDILQLLQSLLVQATLHWMHWIAIVLLSKLVCIVVYCQILPTWSVVHRWKTFTNYLVYKEFWL